MLSKLPRLLRSTPRRSFMVYPIVVIGFETARRGGFEIPGPYFLPLLLWGYLEYRLVRTYRQRHNAGSWGLGEVPKRLLQNGPFRLTRNPMYLGHLIFMLGLALSFWSLLGAGIFIVNVVWFHRRVLWDEALIHGEFGSEYDEYRRRVKRWIPYVL